MNWAQERRNSQKVLDRAGWIPAVEELELLERHFPRGKGVDGGFVPTFIINFHVFAKVVSRMLKHLLALGLILRQEIAQFVDW